MQELSGRKVKRIFVMNGGASTLLNHFTANALRLPVVVLPMDVTALGNIVVQALAMGHIRSVEEAHDLARSAVKTQTIVPHGSWEVPYAKFGSLRHQ
jgi:sugar (pentulose or hexulose) kinase